MQEFEQRRLSAHVLAVETWPDATWARLQRPISWVSDSPLRAVSSALLLVAIAALAALNQRQSGVFQPSPSIELARALVPFAAALVVVLSIYRPWPAFLAAMALTPIWNASPMELIVGPIQVILQTLFAAALVVGCVLRYKTRRRHRRAFDLMASKSQSKHLRRGMPDVRGFRHRYAPFRFVEVGAMAIVALAILSTIASPDPQVSAPVLLHGIIEPILFGAVLVWLRPSRRDLMVLVGALATAIALGTLLNVLQAIYLYRTLSVILSHRMYFALPTYGNVGCYAVVAALTVPLVAGLLVARRQIHLSETATTALGFALIVGLAGLFFSLSKSAWLSATVGLIILALMLLKTWRRRAGVVVGVLALSAVFIPWPGLVLQISPPLNSAYRSAVVAVVGEARFDSWNPATLAGHGSMVERFYAVEGGIDMALDHPLLGVGPNQFRHYYISLGYRPKAAKDILDHAHSLLPEVAAELGIPAATILVVLITAAMWAMWRAYRSARDHVTRLLAASLLAAIATWFLVATAFGCDIYRAVRYQSSDVVAAALLIGMAVALARLVSAENRPPDDVRFREI